MFRTGGVTTLEGRVLEWRLRMYGMDHHSAWTFTRPPLLHNKGLNKLTLLLKRHRNKHQ
jgi:hypothetical protein